jgi:hypothetical protein
MDYHRRRGRRPTATVSLQLKDGMVARWLATLSCLLLLVSVPASSRAPDATEDPAPVLAALEAPRLDGVIDPPQVIVVGRAEIRPAPGARVFVMSAAGRRCGVVIDGAASLLYRVQDPFSISLARRQGRRADGVTFTDAGGEATLSGALRGVAVWGWDLDLGAAAPRAAVDARLPAWLEQILANQLGTNPGVDMVLSAWNADPGYRWAVLHTAGDDLILDVDPRPQVRMEALMRLHKLAATAGVFAGRLGTDDLVDQPIGRHWWDATTLDVASTETDITVVNDTRTHATITTRTRLQALRDGLQLLPMSLLQEQITDDDNRRPQAITRLTIDGAPAPYVQRRSSLLVTLPRALKKGDTTLLEVTTDGQFLEYPAGDNYWVLRTSPWYPRPGPTGEEWAAFKISVSVPAPFVPIPPGEVTQQPSAANGNTAVGWIKGPMQYGTAIAGKYTTLTDERDGARVHVSTYAGGKADEAHRVAGVVHSVRGCLEQALGVPYPFQDLHILEINEWGWGQAPPGVIFITKEALLSSARADQVDEENRSMAERTSRGINERIAHEVAHGWFPHIAKNHAGEENWLSESFAEYMSAVCIERSAANAGRGKFMFNRKLSNWKSEAASISDHGSIYLAGHISGRENDFRDWRNLLYAKGPLVLHALRQELGRVGGEKEGDRLFFTWMRAYIKNFTYKMGGTRFLVAILDQITAKQWQPWFERYVYGTEMPKVN